MFFEEGGCSHIQRGFADIAVTIFHKEDTIMRNTRWMKMIALTMAFVVLFTATAFPVDRYVQAQYEDTGIVFVEDLLDDPTFSGYFDSQLIAQFGTEFLANRDVANLIAGYIYDAIPVNRSGENMYPDSFGGMYIDYYGNLVVLTVDGCQFSRNSEQVLDGFNVDTAIVDTGSVSVRAVDFSHSELLSVYYAIADFMAKSWGNDHCVVGNNITSVGIDTSGNRVEVSLLDISQWQLDLFRTEVVDHPALAFIQVVAGEIWGGLSREEQPLDPYIDSNVVGVQPFSNAQGHPGSTLRTGAAPAGRFVGSLGFRVRRGSQNGFITHAHGTTIGMGIYVGARRIGTVSQRHFQSDSSFVSLSYGSTVSDRNPSAAHIVATPRTPSNILQGDVVTRISTGARDANAHMQHHPIVSSGRVQRTEYTITLPGVGTVHVLRANYVSYGGDSGGIVVTGSGGNQLIAGITVAVHAATNESVFVLASRILVAHNVTLH